MSSYEPTEHEKVEAARNFAMAHYLLAAKASRILREILEDLPQESAARPDLQDSLGLVLEAQTVLHTDYLKLEEAVRVSAERSF